MYLLNISILIGTILFVYYTYSIRNRTKNKHVHDWAPWSAPSSKNYTSNGKDIVTQERRCLICNEAQVKRTILKDI
jgi:hypothetical protein